MTLVVSHPPKECAAASCHESETAFFIGDVALDEYYSAERWPGLGDKAMLQPLTSYVGGMIANAASVYAGLGGQTEFISLLNRSEGSRRLCSELAASRVGVQHMLFDDSMPDSRTIVVLVDGEHSVLIPETGCAPMNLSDETLAALQLRGFLYTTLARVKRLRACGLGAIDVLRRLHRAGRRVVYDLDVVGMSSDDEDFLRNASVVIVNRIGFQASFGNWSDEQFTGWLHRLGIGALVVTLGKDGCRAHTSHETIAVPGIDVPAIDVTGAGDTFGGSLVYALSKTNDPSTALRFATAAASASITKQGPRTGVDSVANVLAFMAANGLTVGPEFACLL